MKTFHSCIVEYVKSPTRSSFSKDVLKLEIFPRDRCVKVCHAFAWNLKQRISALFLCSMFSLFFWIAANLGIVQNSKKGLRRALVLGNFITATRRAPFHILVIKCNQFHSISINFISCFFCLEIHGK